MNLKKRKKYLKTLAIWEKMCYNKNNKYREGGDNNGKQFYKEV